MNQFQLSVIVFLRILYFYKNHKDHLNRNRPNGVQRDYKYLLNQKHILKKILIKMKETSTAIFKTNLERPERYICDYQQITPTFKPK